MNRNDYSFISPYEYGYVQSRCSHVLKVEFWLNVIAFEQLIATCYICHLLNGIFIFTRQGGGCGCILWPNHEHYLIFSSKFTISHFAELGSQCSYTVMDNSLIQLTLLNLMSINLKKNKQTKSHNLIFNFYFYLL